MRYPFAIVRLLLLLLPVVSHLSAQTPPVAEGDALFIKIGNGLNAVMKPTPGASATEINVYIKAGSVYENDSLTGMNRMIAGLIAGKINSALQKGTAGISSSNILFQFNTTSEQTVFHGICNENDITAWLTLLRDSVFTTTFSTSEIDSAKASAERLIATNRTDSKQVFDERLLKEIFRQDYDKINPEGNPQKFKYINDRTVNAFFHRYYVPNNAILTVTGKFDTNVFQDQFNGAFSSLYKSEFDPETITKIIDFHPMIYNNQIIVNDNNISVPEFQICWQFPGTYAYQQGSYFGHLLNAMLNDNNNYLHVIAAKMGCRKLSFDYEANNFTGILRATLQPDKSNLLPTYDWLMNQLNTLNETLINESMLNAGKVIFETEYDQLRQSKAYPEWVVKNWPYSDNSYFIHLKDSVMDINVKEMKQFVGEYLIENAHVTGLRISEADREALHVDSLFTDVNDSVGQYTFTYRPNITDLEGPANAAMMRNLLQWLKANPDVNIKINGFSDVGEYNKAYDDTIIHFIDSIPTFRKTMPDLIAKGYLRPEMMRALKIIKYLNDNGIAQSRLSGTSMPLHSSTREEEEGNMKCTLVLNKMRRVISLHEYHFGKGKTD